MKMDDLLQLGFGNLWRTKFRTILTTLGVTIGIGALVAMVSFGTGMQKNITEVFKENDLFTSIQVMPQKINLNEAMAGNLEEAMSRPDADTPPLDDSALQSIRSLPNVEIAFPEIRFPVKLKFRDQEAKASVQALPRLMGAYKPFDDMTEGTFLQSDTGAVVIISQEALKKLKIRLRSPEQLDPLSLEDSSRGIRTLSSNAIIGQEIELVTSVIDISAIMKNPLGYIANPGKTKFIDKMTTFKIIGIQNKRNEFGSSRFVSDIIIPIQTAASVPRMNIADIRNLMDRKSGDNTFGSIYVRVRKTEDIEMVRTAIETMGFGVFSIMDQLEEIKKGFLIFDTILGAIGTIALIVAALGIINTMVMTILERKKEIGIMKAIGGSENEIKWIFCVEAGTIGMFGSLFGLGLGWLVTRIANFFANIYIANQGGDHVDLFYIPLWLILGAIGFSLAISLLAGLYPAIRAARVDPVEALRHD